jgi:hypothetical protein
MKLYTFSGWLVSVINFIEVGRPGKGSGEPPSYFPCLVGSQENGVRMAKSELWES